MTHTPFIHLHVHSDYSLRDSTIRIRELVGKAVEFNMPMNNCKIYAMRVDSDGFPASSHVTDNSIFQ